MLRVSRARVIAAEAGTVWGLVSDPHSMPRWWPQAVRVEDVRVPTSGGRAHWTAVLQTERGAGVRADFRCVASTRERRYEWEQEVEGTPFERVLRSSRLEVTLQARGEGTEVRLTAADQLRGLSRLGAPMMRSARGRRLDEALAGIERALVGEGGHGA